MGRHSKIFKQIKYLARFEEVNKNSNLNMKFENPNYKYEDTFEDIDLPTKVMEKDPKFNFPEPKRADFALDTAKNIHIKKEKPKRSGFWRCFSNVLCCCCHILEAFN